MRSLVTDIKVGYPSFRWVGYNREALLGVVLLRGIDKFQMFGLCEERLAQSGLSIQQVLNSETARKRMDKISKRPSHPQSSILQNDFTETNSFFVFFQNEGEDVGCVSARMDHLGEGERFEDFWAKAARRWYSEDSSFPVDPHHRLPITLTGKLVYIGDMHMSEDFRGFKKLHLRAALYVVYLLSIDKWPDLSAIYALFMEKFARNGYLSTYLAGETIMAPQILKNDIEGRHDSDWIGVMRPSHLAYYSSLFLSQPHLFDTYRSRS